MKAIRKWMEQIEKGGWIYKCTVALFVLLIIAFFGMFLDSERLESSTRNPLGWCMLSSVFCTFFLIEAKRALSPMLIPFEINRLKRMYHRKGKEQQYRKLCWGMFFAAFAILVISAIRAIIAVM